MPDVVPNRGMQIRTMGAADSSLDRLTEHNIHVYSVQSREAINKHIQELENEWSAECIMEAGAAVVAIIGIVLGAFVSPWFLILPAVITAFFLSHAVFHFCPGLTLLKSRGTRTYREIDTEKFAMKVLRGDGLSLSGDADKTALAERTIAATRAYSSID